jgi:hypothetical protein
MKVYYFGQIWSEFYESGRNLVNVKKKGVFDRCASTKDIVSRWRAWPSSQASMPLAGKAADHDCYLTSAFSATALALAQGAIPCDVGW